MSTVLLALFENSLLFIRLGGDCGNVDGLLGAWIEGDHGELAGEEDVFGLNRLTLLGCFGDLQRNLHTAATSGIGDTPAVLKVRNLGQGMLDVDTVTGGRDSRDSITSVLVCNDSTYKLVRYKAMAVCQGRAYSMHQGP